MIRARILSLLIGPSQGRRRGTYCLPFDASAGKRRKPVRVSFAVGGAFA